MAKINFIAIGGVQENGKNLYIIEVDERLFVLDCGLKYPTSDLYYTSIVVKPQVINLNLNIFLIF